MIIHNHNQNYYLFLDNLKQFSFDIINEKKRIKNEKKEDDF
jgi:hypothetical protein